jgi:hypothetical protein
MKSILAFVIPLEIMLANLLFSLCFRGIPGIATYKMGVILEYVKGHET